MLLELVSVLIALLITRVLWRRYRYDLHKIPSPPELPFIGHAHKMIQGQGQNELTMRTGRWFRELGYPKLMRMSVFGSHLIVCRDTELAKRYVLCGLPELPRQQLWDDNVLLGHDPNARCLLTSTGVTPRVKAVRRAFMESFSSSKLKWSFPQIKSVMADMIKYIETHRKDGPIETQKLFVSLALDILGAVALGMDLEGLSDGDLRKSVLEGGHVSRELVLNPILKHFVRHFPRTRIAQKRLVKINRLTAHWDRLTQDILRRPDPPKGELPLWHALRSVKDPETGKPLGYSDLRGDIAAVIIAGMDTTGHQLAWLLALLATYPRVVDKILEELEEHGFAGENAKDVTLEDLPDLKYLAAAIKEGMRLCAIVTSVFPRFTAKDMTVAGYRVPKGTAFAMVGNRWMDSEADWGDPQVYRPERWLTDEDMSQKWFLGFATGARDCIGQRLAAMELRMTLIVLLKKYTLRLTVPFEELLMNSQSGVVVEAVNGIWIDFKPRTA